jgi:hypothetical protein
VMNRPRTGRSTAARDSNRDPGESELETVKALVREGLLEAKKHNDKARELGLQIVTLEEEIKSKGSSKFTNPLSNVIMITWFVQQNRVRSEPKSFIGPLAQRLLLLNQEFVLAVCSYRVLRYSFRARIGMLITIKLLLSILCTLRRLAAIPI